jgi:hypothetical protein
MQYHPSAQAKYVMEIAQPLMELENFSKENDRCKCEHTKVNIRRKKIKLACS